MLKVLPIIIAIILSLLNVQLKDEKPLQLTNLATTENHLTQDSTNKNLPANAVASNETFQSGKDFVDMNNFTNTLRLTWNAVPGAIRYRISYGDQIIISPTTGVEIAVNSADEFFKITALDFDNVVVLDNVPIASTEINPKAPRTTSEFDQMSYPPLYVVYSWIPSKDANHYEIRLWHDGEVTRNFVTKADSVDESFDFYDETPFISEGEYFYQVRGISAANVAITDWSEKNPGNTFTVHKPARFCALGDSITHGGAVTVPPSQVLCNWETYCSFFVKNLGHSGDTTAQILERFYSDVLPFQPEILFVMAGVNDFRTGIISSQSIKNLAAIRELCEENGILPVFITPTPINPARMFHTQFVKAPPTDWRYHQLQICDWIRKQKNFIDITKEMTDDEGNLKAYLTTDGLHPDSEGKQIIGQAVEKWLNGYLNQNQ